MSEFKVSNSGILSASTNLSAERHIEMERPIPPYDITGPLPRPMMPKNISIQSLNRGWLVTVGCSSFAFTGIEEMMEKITMYLKEPQAVENLYYNNQLF